MERKINNREEKNQAITPIVEITALQFRINPTIRKKKKNQRPMMFCQRRAKTGWWEQEKKQRRSRPLQTFISEYKKLWLTSQSIWLTRTNGQILTYFTRMETTSPKHQLSYMEQSTVPCSLNMFQSQTQ